MGFPFFVLFIQISNTGIFHGFHLYYKFIHGYANTSLKLGALHFSFQKGSINNLSFQIIIVIV